MYGTLPYSWYKPASETNITYIFFVQMAEEFIIKKVFYPSHFEVQWSKPARWLFLATITRMLDIGFCLLSRVRQLFLSKQGFILRTEAVG